MSRRVVAITRLAEIPEGPGCRTRPIFSVAGEGGGHESVLVDELVIDPEAALLQWVAMDEVLLCHILSESIRFHGIDTGPKELPAGSGLLIGPDCRVELLNQSAEEPTRILRVRIRPSQSLGVGRGSLAEIDPIGRRVIRSDRAAVRSLAGTILPTIWEPSLTCIHVMLVPGAHWAWSLPRDQNGLAYVLEGSARFGTTGVVGKRGDVLYFGGGERIPVSTAGPVEFVLVGNPNFKPSAL